MGHVVPEEELVCCPPPLMLQSCQQQGHHAAGALVVHRAAQGCQLQYPSHHLWACPKHSSPQTQVAGSLCLGGLVRGAGHLEGIRNSLSAGQPEGSALVKKSRHL